MLYKILILLSLFLFSCCIYTSKVTIVGAGNVGSEVASMLAMKDIVCEIVLLDIKEGLAEAKAMDIMHSAQFYDYNTNVRGVTNDYSQTANSDIIVLTLGMPRKCGMTREELLGINAGIVKNAIENSLKYSPQAIFLIVTHPMDIMTYLTYKLSGIPKNKIIGIGGILDTSRFKYYLSQEIGCTHSEIHGMVIGGHGDKTMIPLIRFATYKGIPITNILSKEQIDKVVGLTCESGTCLTNMMGTSAWVASGASISYLIDSIINDRKRLISCSVYLEGEYGLNDIAIGVPVIIGKNGVEKIVEFELDEKEKEMLNNSAKIIKKREESLKSLGYFES